MLHNTLLYLTLFLQGLHARARAQEEEIFSLWEQVAVACMKLCLAVIAVLKGGTNRYGSAQRRHQQGLHARARAQEEEIFSLWEQVAVACMKMLNEKCNLERQFSELRNGKCRVGKLSRMVEGGKLSRVEGHKVSVSNEC
ncbi:uncharacterized protein [Arachis hypogaea]|uniref:uncharacterized protein isoform X4 n=1 Tax=Arachis hypogaea TaxID=3818 RepID=UPI003B217A1A